MTGKDVLTLLKEIIYWQFLVSKLRLELSDDNFFPEIFSENFAKFNSL